MSAAFTERAEAAMRACSCSIARRQALALNAACANAWRALLSGGSNPICSGFMEVPRLVAASLVWDMELAPILDLMRKLGLGVSLRMA